MNCSIHVLLLVITKQVAQELTDVGVIRICVSIAISNTIWLSDFIVVNITFTKHSVKHVHQSCSFC